jgi:hypothetical protein
MEFNMALVQGLKAELTFRYWVASLAWKNIGGWAKGWTTESFITELRSLCNDNGRVGSHADELLDDIIHNKERKPLHESGRVVSLHARTNIMGHRPHIAIVDDLRDNVAAG